MEENSCITESFLPQEIKIDKLTETNEKKPLPNFSQLIDEKISHQTNIQRKFEYEVFIKPKRIKQINEELLFKKQRLEHCINFLWHDELCEEGERVYIKSPGKENQYLDMEKDSMDIKILFCEFYLCTKDKEKIPEEIELLEAMIQFLEND